MTNKFFTSQKVAKKVKESVNLVEKGKSLSAVKDVVQVKVQLASTMNGTKISTNINNNNNNYDSIKL